MITIVLAVSRYGLFLIHKVQVVFPAAEGQGRALRRRVAFSHGSGFVVGRTRASMLRWYYRVIVQGGSVAYPPGVGVTAEAHGTLVWFVQ